MMERLFTRDLSHGQHTGNEVMLAVGKKSEEKNWLGTKPYSTGNISTCVCANCGFTELWSHHFEALLHDPENGVHFIDGEEPPDA